jgi:hypothetical protein
MLKITQIKVVVAVVNKISKDLHHRIIRAQEKVECPPKNNQLLMKEGFLVKLKAYLVEDSYYRNSVIYTVIGN